MNSSNRVPVSLADGTGQALISPGLSGDAGSAYLGKARIKDVEAKLGALISKMSIPHVLIIR
jgi:hypothetical protein